MRILYLSKYAVSPKYGQPTRQFYFCKYLSRIPGNSVRLVSSRSTIVKTIPRFRGRAKHEECDGLSHTILNGPQVELGFGLKRIWSWAWFEIQILRSYFDLKRWKPDVVIVSSLSILTFLTGIILKLLLRIPLVVEVRDVYPATLVQVGGYSRWHPAVIILGRIEYLGYRFANAIISSLPNLEPHVASVLGRPKKVTYLPMGFDPESRGVAPPSDKAVATIEAIKAKGSTLTLGYCGTVGLANALQEALLAVEQIGPEHPGIHLWVIGDGPLLNFYRERFGNCPNIHFAGRHEKTDLPYLLDLIDVAINPWLDKPIYQFGVSPNKWIDYMASGTPILVSYSGFRFLIESEEIGWFIPPEDQSAFQNAVIRLQDEPKAELVRRGKNGADFLMQKLTYDKLAAKLNETIERVVGCAGSLQTDQSS